MMSPARHTRLFAGIASGLASAVGVFGVVTWGLQKRGISILPPDYVPMSSVTAAMLVLLGSAFAARVAWPTSTRVCRMGMASALIGLLVGLFAILIYPRAIPLPWEIWLHTRELVADRNLSFRMSPVAALVLILSCASLLARSCTLRSPEKTRWAVAPAAGLGLLIAAIVAVGYLSSPLVIRGGIVAPMAIVTALGFAALNLALLLFPTTEELLSRWRAGDQARGEGRNSRGTILVVSLLALLAVTAGWLYYLRNSAVAARESVYSLLNAVSALQVAQIDEWRRERFGDGRVIALTPNTLRSVETLMGGGDDPSALDRQQKWLDARRSAYGYDSATIFDSQGRARLTTPESSPLGAPALPEDWRETLNLQDVVLTDFHRTGGSPVHLDLLVAVRDSRNLAAVVQLRIDPERQLLPLLSRWPTRGDSGESILLRQEGAEYVYLSGLRGRPGASLTRRPRASDLDAVAELVENGPTTLQQAVDYRGALVLFVSRRIPGTTWVLETKIDEAEALAPARREAQLISAIMALLLLALGQAGLFAWRRREAESLRRSLEAERKHRAISERLALVTRHANDVIFMFDEDLRIIEASERVGDFYGRTPEEMKRLTMKDLWPPSAAGQLSARVEDALGSDGSLFEVSHVRGDGSEFPVEVSTRPVTIDGRRYLFSIIRDITERRHHEAEIERLTRLYSALSHVNQSIVHARDRESFLNSVCQALVQSGAILMAWIGRRDPEASDLRIDALYGDATGYLDGAEPRAASDGHRSDPAARALEEGRVVVCNDFLADPSSEPRREAARKAGFHAAVAIPLPMREGTPVGVLTAYAAERDAFGADEMSLMNEVASDIVFGLDTLESEAARRKADADLHASLSEKEALLREVHHRVGNNLQVILSLLRLESGRASEPAAQTVLRDMQGRIHSMAQLHETVYRSGNFARVNLADYIQRLGSQLLRLYSAGNDAVRITFELERVSVDIDRAIPCGLMVNELVTNSLRHAFPDGPRGEIRVVLRQSAESGILLEVSDSGVGLPADFEDRRSRSLGLQLVVDLARQIKGRLEVSQNAGSGACFRVIFEEGSPAAPRYPLPS